VGVRQLSSSSPADRHRVRKPVCDSEREGG
jgi:hypothetical protein